MTIPIRRRPLGRAALLAAFLIPAAAHAQAVQSAAPTAAVQFPATSVGRLGAELLEVINAADPARTDAFIRDRLRPDTAAGALEERRQYFATVRRQSGGMEAVEVSPAAGGVELSFLARARSGRWARVYMGLDPRDSTRLEGWIVFRAPDPNEPPRRWREGRLSEAEITAEIDAQVSALARADRFSGVVLVARGDRVLFHQAYGMAEKAFGVPNRPDTKFNLGSMNKMFTSVAIAQLVEAGKLRFTDTLASVLPDYPNQEVARRITIGQILTHTAGLGDIFTPDFFRDQSRYREPRDYFPLFAHDPPRFEPGARYDYSNAGFVVLGAVIEAVSGQSYYDYIRQHVYAPAGMTDTDSYEMTSVVPNLAVGYAYFTDDPLQMNPRRNNWAFLPVKGSPAGGGYSTAPDLLRFARALREGRLVSREMVERITDIHVRPNPQVATRGYGYGFDIREMGGRQWRGHSGGGPASGINSDLEIDWTGEWVVIAMGNYDAPITQQVAREIAAFVARQ